MEGQKAWSVLKSCQYQLRVGFGGPYALDFSAVMQVAAARGAASELLSELLPDIEAILIAKLRAASADAGGGEG